MTYQRKNDCSTNLIFQEYIFFEDSHIRQINSHLFPRNKKCCSSIFPFSLLKSPNQGKNHVVPFHRRWHTNLKTKKRQLRLGTIYFWLPKKCNSIARMVLVTDPITVYTYPRRNTKCMWGSQYISLYAKLRFPKDQNQLFRLSYVAHKFLSREGDLWQSL